MTRLILAWLSLALLLAPARAAGDSQYPPRIRLGVFFLPKAPPELPKALAQLLKREFSSLKPAVKLVSSAKDTPLGTGESLPWFAKTLSPGRRATLARSEHALMLAFAQVSPKQVRDAYRLVLALAKAHKAIPWDEETREWLELDQWQKRRIDGWKGDMPEIESHTVSHFYRDEGEEHRVVTLGMRKFGAPDLVINRLLQSDGERANALLMLASHTLVAGGKLGPGGKLALDLEGKSFEIILVPAKRDEGDPDNRLLEISFAREPGAGLHQRHASLFNRIFGSSQRGITPIASDDPELTAARDRARAKLPSVAARFRKGLEVGQRLIVKGPFRGSGDTEWMWVEVASWNGRRIKGVLLNEPNNVPGLSEGSEVEVAEGDVYDYMIMGPGDHKEGGETNEIAIKRQKP
jgi:uncharacterized protein YegJ (DUF2314 family)